MDASHLPMFENVDMIQVGARNMQNFELLKRLGKVDKPILLKRGLSSTIQELLMSAEYILAGGNSNVILCERGIRTFETYTRNTLDISAVPVLKELTHLPVIIDPSHASGMARLVKPLSLAAVAAGADGLIIEVHNDPAHALCDGPQSLTPEAFDELMTQIRTLLPLIQAQKIRKAAPSMNIGIIGLGLIGGSMAKAIKAYRNDVIFGADHNEDVIVQAMSDGVIAGKLNEETIPQCDFIFIAIYPEAAGISHLYRPSDSERETVVVDGCGVKRFVCDAMRPVSEAYGFTFIGGHPMAGMEVAGYETQRRRYTAAPL